MEIDLDEERATVAQALHEDADRLDDDALLCELAHRPTDALRARVRAYFLRAAAAHLLSPQSPNPEPTPGSPPSTDPTIEKTNGGA